jgi:hypothetical protein
MVNSLRSASGAGALTVDPALASVAQQWAAHMAGAASVSHNPNLSVLAPQGWTKMGEITGSGYSVNAVFSVLAASSSSTTVVDPVFNRTGIGVATDSKGQVWVAEDFGAYPPATPPAMVFPTPGIVIFPSAQAFSWAQAPGAVYYCLTVGTTKGGVDLVNSGLLGAGRLSFPVPALPGGVLWARVYSFSQGAWIFTDTAFSVTGPSTAVLTRPTNGAINVDPAQPFTWTPVASASYYGVTVGTAKGGYELVNSGPLPGTQSSYRVAALPAGKTLWARVYSLIAGSWNHYVDITFTTAGAAKAP